MLTIRISGIDGVQHALDLLADGARALGRMRVTVGTDLPYAYGIEVGYRRSGRLARRAGGLFYLSDAFQAVVPKIGPTLEAAVPQGAEAVRAAFLGLGYQIEAGAKARETAVRTGSLRRSIHTAVD